MKPSRPAYPRQRAADGWSENGSRPCVSRASGSRHRLADFVEEVGGKVRAVLPYNRIQVFVDPEALEVGDVFEGFEYLAVEVRAQVNESLVTVFEREQQPMFPAYSALLTKCMARYSYIAMTIPKNRLSSGTGGCYSGLHESQASE